LLELYLGLLVVEFLSYSHQKLTKTLQIIFIAAGTYQFEQTVVHDRLRQHPQLVQFAYESAVNISQC